MKIEVKFWLELMCFLTFLKVCYQTVAGRDQPLDIFMKETSIEV